MFTGDIITDQQFYTFRRKEVLFLLFPSILLVAVQVFSENLYLTLGLALIVFLLLYFSIQNRKQLKQSKSNLQLCITTDQIEIRTEDKEVKKWYKMDEIEQISLESEFSFPDETIKDLVQNKLYRNVLRFTHKSEPVEIDFLFDSYYQMEQLKKLRLHWEKSGILV